MASSSQWDRNAYFMAIPYFPLVSAGDVSPGPSHEIIPKLTLAEAKPCSFQIPGWVEPSHRCHHSILHNKPCALTHGHKKLWLFFLMLSEDTVSSPLSLTAIGFQDTV